MKNNVRENQIAKISHQISGIQNNKGTLGTVTNQASIVKQAALNVLKFSGNFKEWSIFYDIFVALVHSNKALTDIQRFFFYLKSTLTRDSIRVIQCFETKLKYYQIAWKCLTERYNNKRLLAQNHTIVIFELEFIEKESESKL